MARCKDCKRRKAEKDKQYGGRSARCYFKWWRRSIRGGKDPGDVNPWAGF